MEDKSPCGQSGDNCREHVLAIYETLNILSGKWKIAIIGSLRFGRKRFMELQRDVEGIGPKMLSKELHELEKNGLVKRTVYDTRPITVDYDMTEYGKTLQTIIKEMADWGVKHRLKTQQHSSAESQLA